MIINTNTLSWLVILATKLRSWVWLRLRTISRGMSEIGIQFIWLSFKVKRRTILSRRKYQGFRFDVHCLYVTIFEIHRNHSKYIRDKQTQILVYIRISIIAAMFLRHSRRKRRKYVSTSKARAVEMCYQLAEIYVSLMSSWYYRVITT